jgi:hypothetical protein
MQPGTMGLIELFKYREIYQVLKRVQRSLTSMTVPKTLVMMKLMGTMSAPW